MGMMVQGLSPGVEHRDQADLGAEVRGIGRDGAQGLGGGPHQDVIDHRLVVECDLAQLRREREHHVEIGRPAAVRRGAPRATRRAPGSGTWGSAGCGRIVGDAGVAAIGALLDMAAQRRGPARRDGAHDAAFDARPCGRHGPADKPPRGGGRCPPPRPRPARRRLSSTPPPQIEPVERARGVGDRGGRRLRIQRPLSTAGLWPSSTWMMRMSVPLSKRCVAKL